MAFSIRRVLVWGGWGLVLVAGLGGLFVWDTYRSYEVAIGEFERVVGPAGHASYVGEPVPARANTAVAVPAAMKDVLFEADWSRAPEPAAWTGEDADEARATLEKERDALVALEHALGLNQCVWPSVPEEATSWSSEILTGSRLLRLLGFVGVLDANRDHVERSFRGLGRLAECLYAQPHLVGTLVGTAVTRARLEVVRAVVASPGVEPDLLELLSAGLERDLDTDRVAWAVAAEGAFALHFIENPQLAASTPRLGPVYPVFARRVAAGLARRWVDLREWSEKPLEALLSETVAETKGSVPTAGVIADMLIPNIRDAVVRIRALEALTRLGLVAIEGRRQGFATGSYEDALAARPDLATLPEGDGGIVILDPDLESLLRQRFVDPSSGPTPGTEATLQLTVWRLPPVPERR